MTSSPMTEDTVTLVGVAKDYGGHLAVRGVGFSLRAGETVALVGHNGAGKSTLIRLMLGLIRPTGGEVRVLGEDPADPRAVRARREVGCLPENIEFPPAMTGAEVLAFYARLKRQPVKHNGWLLERVGLGEAARRRVGGYSRGMLQRLGLAQALLGNPRLLLLDEPTAGLDPELRQSVYEVIRDLRDAGATVLLSSHALTELEERADRVIVMNRGVLIADGTLGDLRSLAQLPVRIRLQISAGEMAYLPRCIGPASPWRLVGRDRVELYCAYDQKMDVFAEIANLPVGVEDIDITPPTLDELYAHFLFQEAAQ